MSRSMRLSSGTRYGLLASYGWQRVQLEYTDSSYTPAYGTSQVLELGAIVFPSATSSIRVGFTGSFGRRSTGVTGAFEWEACNLLDQGCEFGGSPRTEDALGAIKLPAYAGSIWGSGGTGICDWLAET